MNQSLSAQHPYSSFLIATLALIIFCVLQFLMILKVNHGVFLYTIDDPYIHLNLATQLIQGHYGVSAHAFSAPSSSIIWPFILAPFAHLSGFIYVPLILNALCAIGVLALLSRIINTTCGQSALNSLCFKLCCFFIFVLAINLVGNLFNGMEHELQNLTCLLIALGLIIYCQQQRCPKWFWLAVIIAPLIRYECLSISLACIVFFVSERRYIGPIIAACIIGGCLISFSLFLHSHNLGWLPSSILAKEELGNFLLQAKLNIYNDLMVNHVAFVPILYTLLLLPKLFTGTTQHKKLAWLTCFVIGAHFLFGKFDFWQLRYSVYLGALSLPILLYLYHDTLLAFKEKVVNTTISFIGIVIVFLVFLPSLIIGSLSVPTKSHNIYQQQYQMRQMVLHYYKGPVAVNDIGLMSYKNPYPVLDLWGLASQQSLLLRFAHQKDWMQQLVIQHNIKLVMIYPQWFGQQIPAQWQLLGQLSRPVNSLPSIGSPVNIYATNKAAIPKVLQMLTSYQAKNHNVNLKILKSRM